ncbi:MAG TPA: K(+)-transporting ATPase subunit F [Steroidobacteraceae bacterium]|nr:K(+)-transporting ATPase subunit F [Steroidobacteraceae bacterium]
MSIVHAASGILALCLLAYLIYALFQPEKF